VIDAVIDISHSVRVTDFGLARERNAILGVLHKATEGGDWRDPAYQDRRQQAAAAGLLWGAYHFGTHQYSGADQANAFLAAAQPGSETLLALDLELNERNPANSMTLDQAEDFVLTILAATGRLPLVYTHPAWADGRPMGGGKTLGGAVTTQSVISQCDLWLADYRSQPQLPMAWATTGWRLWQYSGESNRSVNSSSPGRNVSGIDHCDRNFFLGDAPALAQYWKSGLQPGLENNSQLVSMAK
jgi:lysozyme